jgi:hypothetical protein
VDKTTAQNSAVLKGTIDENRVFVSNSIHSTYLRPEREKRVSLEYLLGLINPTLIGVFHNSMRVKATDLHPQMLVSNLEKLPIRNVSERQQDEISYLVKNILAAK